MSISKSLWSLTQEFSLTVTLLVVVSRLTAASSECRYFYETQPPSNLTCNPYTNGLSIECSLSVEDSLPNQITVGWYYSEEWPPSRANQVRPEAINSTRNGSVFQSTLSVDCPQTGYYFCVPESLSDEPLLNSTATHVLNQTLYSSEPDCGLGQVLSTVQFECAQQLDSSNPMQQFSTILLYVGSGVLVFSIILAVVVTLSTLCYCKRRKTNRYRYPKSKGHRSRVVRGSLTINRNNGVHVSPTTIDVISNVQSHQDKNLQQDANIQQDENIRQDEGEQGSFSDLDHSTLNASYSYVEPNSVLTYEEIDGFRSGWISPDYMHHTHQNLWEQVSGDIDESGQSDASIRLPEFNTRKMSAESYLIPHSTLRRQSSSSISTASETSFNQGGDFTARYVNFPGLTENRYNSNMSSRARPTLKTVTESEQSGSVKEGSENGDIPSASPVATKPPSRHLKQVFSLPVITHSPTPRKSRSTIYTKPHKPRRLQTVGRSIQHSATPKGPIYQGLTHTTMEYCSLYHRVNN